MVAARAFVIVLRPPTTRYRGCSRNARNSYHYHHKCCHTIQYDVRVAGVCVYKMVRVPLGVERS